MKTVTAKGAALVAGLALALSACGGGQGSQGTTSDGDKVLSGANLIVSSKEFTESILLGKILAVAFEDAGAKVDDQTGLTGSATVRAALEASEIDIYWDYTGTGWVNYLGHTPADTPDDLHAALAQEDLEKNGIAWLPPAPFENTYAIAVKSDFAAEHGLETISDSVELIKSDPSVSSICAASEFINRDDGLPGLERAYEFKYADVVELDLSLVYTQVGSSCMFGEVTSTDARNLSNDLQLLTDDRKFMVEYVGAVTLRQETLEQYPAIKEIVAPISERLTTQVVTELNGRIDLDGENPEDVAEDWLESEGLLG